MNSETPNASETVRPSIRPLRLRTAAPTAMSLKLFAGLSIVLGGMACVAALVGLVQTQMVEPPKNPEWSVGLGLWMIGLGIVVVFGGVGMWRRRQWGWWLMTGLFLLLALASGAAMLLALINWLWQLRLQFGLAGPFQPLEPEIDEIARGLGIDWTTTPLARISELCSAQQTGEATKLYREHFACDWDDAHAAIARWPTEIVPNKLWHIARAVQAPTTG